MQNSSQLEDEPIKQDTDICIPLNLSVPNSSGQSDHSSPDLPGSNSHDCGNGNLSQESLDEWRAIRNEQDKAYEESLEADKEKVHIYINVGMALTRPLSLNKCNGSELLNTAAISPFTNITCPMSVSRHDNSQMR